MFLYGSECWAMKKECDCKILSAEMSWLQRIGGISGRERRQNEDIRVQLQHEVTVTDRVQQTD